ncbi:MAG: serine/threonine-protein kinase [Planctomycetaceae bacterium]
MNKPTSDNATSAESRNPPSTSDTAADNLEATFIPNTDSSKNAPKRDIAETAPQKPAMTKKDPKKVNQLGEFKLVKKLGQGGMGEVFLATQVGLERKVAIKILAKQFAKKPDFVQRFYREARSMAKLDHPHIVRCYSVGEDIGIHYVAIEFIDGLSMQKWMDKLGHLSIGDALHCTLVCAEALQHAHELGLIHRDIKPDNMLVTITGVLKVADMGLAKALDEDVSMTQSGTGMGTPLYMAPEQARNAKHVDLRTDVYALGCSLYYFLTGKLPFTGENTMELIVAKEKGQFTPARRLNSEIPERLDLMIDKMISKDPKHRYTSCAEIIKDLESLGLDNPSLTFIAETGVDPATRASSPGRRSSPTIAPPGLTQPPAAQRTRQATSSQAQASSAALDDHQPDTSTQLWYVRYTNTEGRVAVAKMTSAQIKQSIRSGMIDLRARASLTSNGDFLPLAQYAEFETAMRGLAAKTKAEARSHNLAEEYKKLDRQHGRRKYWRMLQNFIQNTLGAFSLVLYLAVIAGIGFLGYKYIPVIYQKVAAQYNLTAPDTDAPAAPEDTPVSQ